MDRLSKFHSLYKDAWYGRLCNSLKPADKERIENFINANAHLSASEFAKKLQTENLGADKRSLLVGELLHVSNQEVKRV